MRKRSGLYIQQKAYVEPSYEYNPKVYTILYKIVQIAALFCITVGFIGSWNKLLGGQVYESLYVQDKNLPQWNHLLCWIALCCIGIGIVFSIPKVKYAVAIGWGILWLAIIAYYKEPIIGSAMYTIQRFLEIYNVYFGTKLSIPNVVDYGWEWMVKFYFAIAFFVAMWSAMDIIWFGKVRIPMFIEIATCSVIFMVGKVPDTFYTLMAFGGILAVYFLGKKRKLYIENQKTELVVLHQVLQEKIGVQKSLFMVFMSLITVLVVQKTLLPDGFLWFENHRDIVSTIRTIGQMNAIEDWNSIVDLVVKEESDKAGMGISGGDLGSVNSIYGTNRTDLKVRLDSGFSVTYQGAVYLKAFVGSIYKGDSWKQLSEGLYQKEAIEDQNENLRQLWQSVYNEELKYLTITVENLAASTEYAYIPYFAIIEKQKKQYHVNGWLDSEGEKIQTYDVMPGISPQNVLTLLQSIDGNWKVDVGKHPKKKILEKCLEYPEGTLQDVKNDFFVTSEYEESWKFPELTTAIYKYLSDKTSYTTSPGKTPKNRDFVEYFLMENQKGYCSHYAASATMLYRMCGYPARYVEGYYLKQVREGMDAHVKNYAAHAWVEVYLQDLGWIPVEMTPGYDQGIVLSDPSLTPSTEETTEEESSSEESSTEETSEGRKPEPLETKNPGESQGNQQQGGKGNNPGIKITIPPTFWKILIAILLIGSGIWARHAFLLQMRQKQICQGGNRKVVLNLYKQTCRLAAKEKIMLGVECDSSIMQKELSIENLEHIEQWKKTIEKAYFSAAPLTKEERKLAWYLYGMVYHLVEKKRGQFWMAYVYCYPEPQRRRKMK